MKLFWYVAVGSAAGGVARFALSGFIQLRAGTSFPFATLIINVTGSMLLGFLMRSSLQAGALSPEARALLATGFCGGYTTFSTFSYETAALIEGGQYGRASLYVSASAALALLGTFAGFALAERFIALRGHG